DGKPVLDFRGSWASVRADAGLPKLLFHDLRRSAVRNMVRNDVPEAVAMKVTGHRTRAVFERYNIVSENDLRGAAAKMARRDTERDSFGHNLGHNQAQAVPVAMPQAIN